MRGRVCWVVVGLMSSLIGLGCGMRAEEMVPKSVNVLNRQPGTVAVVTDNSGVQGNRVWTATELANKHKEIGQATEQAITKFNVFAGGVKPAGQSDYVLEIRYTNVDEPAFGLNFDATLDATWKLMTASPPRTVWEKAISGTGRATFGDAVAAHIQAGLEALSQQHISGASAR